jgi:hypothetical protein
MEHAIKTQVRITDARNTVNSVDDEVFSLLNCNGCWCLRRYERTQLTLNVTFSRF